MTQDPDNTPGKPRKHSKKPASPLDAAIATLLEGEQMSTPLIRYNARDNRQRIVTRQPSKITNVRDTIIRIQQDADPIGFLADIQNGALIEINAAVVNPDTGEIENQVYFEQATLKQRIDVAKYLASKVLPSLSIQKVVTDDSKPPPDDDRAYVPGEAGAPSFAQLVNAASTKAAEIYQANPRKAPVTEPIPGSAADDWMGVDWLDEDKDAPDE